MLFMDAVKFLIKRICYTFVYINQSPFINLTIFTDGEAGNTVGNNTGLQRGEDH